MDSETNLRKRIESIEKMNFIRHRDTCSLVKEMIIPRYGEKPNGLVIIEIGSRTGITSELISGIFPLSDVIGIDESKELIEHARLNHSKLSSFVWADITQKDFLDQLRNQGYAIPLADIIIMMHLFHLRDTKISTILDNIVSLLKPSIVRKLSINSLIRDDLIL